MTDTAFEFPEGKALRIDTEIGLSSPNQIADLLKEAADMEHVDDLDRTILLQAASSVAVMQPVMDQAINLLNTVSAAHDENVRLTASELFLSLSIVQPTMTEVEED